MDPRPFLDTGHQVFLDSLCELLGVLEPQEHMKVGRKEGKAHDFNWIEGLGAAEDPEKDVVELLGRAQEKAPLDGAAGDLDEAPTFGHEAEMATHAHKKSENGGRILRSRSKFLRKVAESRRGRVALAISGYFDGTYAREFHRP
jgi:hypothetical protein